MARKASDHSWAGFSVALPARRVGAVRGARRHQAEQHHARLILQDQARDFGLAKLVDHGARLRTTHKVQGTMGYIDPEFVNTGRPSTESDVYSFGVLLEVESGRRPVVEMADGIFALLRWVWNLHGRNAILDAVDGRLAGACDELQMERLLVIGLWCAHPDRSERPSMAQVMYILENEDARPPALLPRMYTSLTDDELAVAAYGGGALSSATFSSATNATTVNAASSSESSSTALLQ